MSFAITDSGLFISWVKNYNHNRTHYTHGGISVQGFDLKLKRTCYQSQKYFQNIEKAAILPRSYVPYALDYNFYINLWNLENNLRQTNSCLQSIEFHYDMKPPRYEPLDPRLFDPPPTYEEAMNKTFSSFTNHEYDDILY